MSDIVERLRDHATDWNGAQMPDLEPAKGDPTAGMLREAAAEITRLRAENEALKDRLGLKGAGCACRFEDDGETQTTWCAVHARLRADLAAAQADAKSWKTVALSNQAASQSHQERWAKAEAELAEMTTERDAALEWAEKAERLERELASGSFYKEADIDRLMAERDAAQEREQRMERALADIEDGLGEDEMDGNTARMMRAVARAALGEPQAQGCSKWGPDFPPSCCTAWEDCVSDGMCHDPNCGAPSQHSSEDSPND